MAAVTQHRPFDALAGRRYGSFAGKPAYSGSTHPVGVLTQHRPDAAIGGQRYGAFSGKGATAGPTITSVTPVSGTELSVAWTGTATEYRLNAGAAQTLLDTVSPATISGLTPNTEYSVELRDGAGAWSSPVSAWTDNTGGGGGGLSSDAALAATGGSGTFSGTATGPDGAYMSATGGSGTFSGAASSPATVALAATGGSGTFSGAASVPSTGASAAEIWAYVMANGQTAEQNMLTMLEYLSDLHLIHGLRAGSPLSVTETERSAGAIVQAISEAAGVVTVTR